jgi:uncharacterized protein (DUF427 family)
VNGRPEPVGRGQESVWSYPRPAIAEPCSSHLLIMHCGQLVAETRQSVRTLETSHPPCFYFPPGDVDRSRLAVAPRRSVCEWKGAAVYFDVIVAGDTLAAAGWSYSEPSPAFAMLRGYIAFYAAPFEHCLVDGEQVMPQPGGFYGGWITTRIVGPFKGEPGSRHW